MNNKNGSTLLIIAFLITFISEAMVLAMEISAVGPQAAFPNVVRILLTAGLCFGIWNGVAWTRVVMVALTAAAFIFSLLGAIKFMVPAFWIYTLKYAFIIYVLAIDKNVSAFMQSQKKKRLGTSADDQASDDDRHNTAPGDKASKKPVQHETLINQTVVTKAPIPDEDPHA